MQRKLTGSSSAPTHLIAPLFIALLLVTNHWSSAIARANDLGQPTIPWVAFDGGGPGIGVNNVERAIAPATVQRLRRLWTTSLPAVVDGAPAVLPHITTLHGMKDLLFVTTTQGSLLAVDANTGAIVWRRDTHGPRYTTSSPAIDPYSYLYVYSYGLDGKVHQYEVGTGNEITQKWPVPITRIPNLEKGSSALNIYNGYLYMSTASFDDTGHYVGHIVAINVARTTSTVFNTLCSDKRMLLVDTPSRPNYCPRVGGGVWGRAGVVGDPVSGNVYATVGNGNFNADKGGHDYGESILEFSPNLSRLIDSYTPASYPFLNDVDLDLGSAAPLLLPRQARSRTPYMLVQVSKNAEVRLINRFNMSGKGGPNHIGGELQVLLLPQYQACNELNHPIAWKDASNTTWVFITSSCGLYAYKVLTDSRGRSQLRFAYKSENSKAPNYSAGGTSPFIADGVLFVQNTSVINAIEPTTGRILWRSTQPSAGGTVNGKHWQTPVVVNGHLYTADGTRHLYAYGLS